MYALLWIVAVQIAISATQKLFALFKTLFQTLYADVQSVFVSNTRRSTNPWFVLFYLILISYVFRIFNAGLGLLDNKRNFFFPYDITFNFLLSGASNYVIFFVASPMPLFDVAIHYLLFAHPEDHFWSSLYRLFVVNTQKYIVRYFPSGKVMQGSLGRTLKVIFKTFIRVNLRFSKGSPKNYVLAMANIALIFQTLYYQAVAGK